MKKLTLGLLSAAALATTVLLVRQQKEVGQGHDAAIPAGEKQPTTISMDRMRELVL